MEKQEIKQEKMSADVLIIGGGIAGITAAISVKETNPDISVLVVEKQTAGYAGKANKGGGVLQYFDLEKTTPEMDPKTMEKTTPEADPRMTVKITRIPTPKRSRLQ